MKTKEQSKSESKSTKSASKSISKSTTKITPEVTKNPTKKVTATNISTNTTGAIIGLLAVIIALFLGAVLLIVQMPGDPARGYHFEVLIKQDAVVTTIPNYLVVQFRDEFKLDHQKDIDNEDREEARRKRERHVLQEENTYIIQKYSHQSYLVGIAPHARMEEVIDALERHREVQSVVPLYR